MDKIYINDLEFIGYHGVFEEEKKLGQKFLVSLELFTSLREAAKNNDISHTTHYGLVSADVEKIFFSKKYDLIESLAEDIAREILKKYNLIEKVKVKIKKPWAPVGIILDNVAVEIERKWDISYLSLGSNMGNKKENLEKAIEEISKIEDTFILSKAEIIETEPFGYTEQDNFLNTCIGVRTLLTARELLEKLLKIELDMGRERKIKWGPRIIDLDIIFYNKDVFEEDDLIIPHPYMEHRGFVLNPLSEIAGSFVHPLLLKRVSTLKKELEENEK
ncbi:MAG: 2-amino-4-hydroxy-6-hydroxymethyldihydropteridine diphosphokinase [Fusobacterium sp.]|nr:2-amino-4-hydroxy-6-hydroxymethyldihydropteridine diphosphokinase [Fusobacterium sp.]